MYKFVVLCLLAVDSLLLCHCFSGLYVDNGLDQTVVQRYLSETEKKAMEEEILDLLGLPERPRTGRRLQSKLLNSGSKYLMDVYQSLLDSDNHDNHLNISAKDSSIIQESDAIVSFKSQTDESTTLRHKKGRWLKFDVSEISPEAMIVDAELRLYQVGGVSSRNDKTFTLSLHRLQDDFSGSSVHYVTSANVTSDGEGWLSLNVTSTLAQWVLNPTTNYGLYLSAHTLTGTEVKPEEIGVMSSEDESNQPFLVGFLRGTGEMGPGGTTRAPRRRRETRRRKNSSPVYPSNPLAEWIEPQRSCQIQTLYVSFKDLNWQDWIIAPEGYGAFYCRGECNFPLNAHMNATNHAIVQTLVHLMKPLTVPKPCCAPTRLTPISVLYYLEDSNVILKKYKNMVVKSCGCH